MSESVYNNNYQKMIFFKGNIENEANLKKENPDKKSKEAEIEKVYFHGMEIHSKKFQKKVRRNHTLLYTILINSMIIIGFIMTVWLFGVFGG